MSNLVRISVCLSVCLSVSDGMLLCVTVWAQERVLSVCVYMAVPVSETNNQTFFSSTKTLSCTPPVLFVEDIHLLDLSGNWHYVCRCAKQRKKGKQRTEKGEWRNNSISIKANVPWIRKTEKTKVESISVSVSLSFHLFHLIHCSDIVWLFKGCCFFECIWHDLKTKRL